MRSIVRKAVNEFYSQVEEDLKEGKISFAKAADVFLELHPQYIDYAPTTIKRYLLDFKASPEKFTEIDTSKYRPVQEQSPDLSGDFSFTGEIDLPASWAEDRPKHVLSGFKKLGVISDIHIPYHDCGAISAAMSHLKKQEVDAILLNGDIMDFKSICHHLSRTRVKYATLMEEIVVGRKFLTELRKFFPDIPIFYKEGNHEVWLTMHVNKVPQIASLEGIDIPSILKLKELEIGFIHEWQVMTFGKLYIIHGHEVKLGSVFPAKKLWDKTFVNCLAGHVHRQSEHSISAMSSDIKGCWTTGCLADLHPSYAGANPQASHGFAIVDLLEDDMFHVELKRIRNGRVI